MAAVFRLLLAGGSPSLCCFPFSLLVQAVASAREEIPASNEGSTAPSRHSKVGGAHEERTCATTVGSHLFIAHTSREVNVVLVTIIAASVLLYRWCRLWNAKGRYSGFENKTQPSFNTTKSTRPVLIVRLALGCTCRNGPACVKDTRHFGEHLSGCPTARFA